MTPTREQPANAQDYTTVRCPNCNHIAAREQGERITAEVAIRGQNRHRMVAWRQAEFTCPRCGHIWLHVVGQRASEGADRG